MTQKQVFVGNLPFSTGWQDLKDLFREAGDVIRADISLNPSGKSRGFGTVLFASESGAETAIQLFNNYDLGGRRLEVREDWAVSPSPKREIIQNEESEDTLDGDASIINSRSLHVSNIPFSIQWQDLKDIFRTAGQVVRVEIKTDSKGNSKGYGHVLMGSSNDAKKAYLLLNGYEIQGRHLDIKPDRLYKESFNENTTTTTTNSNSKDSAEPQQNNQEIGNVLFVSNLSYSLQWQDLKDIFKEAGSVLRADVARDTFGRHKGYGQVVMSNKEEASKAIYLLNGREVQGRQIEVREDKFGGPNSFLGTGTQVYVGNLPYSLKWQELKDFFRDSGFNPLHAEILINSQTKRSKGCGIVRFGTKESAERAIESLDGFEISGRKILLRLDKYS